MENIKLSILINWKDYNSQIDTLIASFKLEDYENVNVIVLTNFIKGSIYDLRCRGLYILKKETKGDVDAFNHLTRFVKDKLMDTTHILYLEEHVSFSFNPLPVLLEKLNNGYSDCLITVMHGDYDKYGKYIYNDLDNIFDYRNKTSFKNIDVQVKEEKKFQTFNPYFFILPINQIRPVPTYFYSFLGINNSFIFNDKKVSFLEDKIYLKDLPFENKLYPSGLYYFFRNNLILNQLNKKLSIDKIKEYILNEIEINLCFYRYQDVISILHALNDFINGEEYLSQLDLSYYHSFISSINPILRTSNELDTFFSWKEWEKTRNVISEKEISLNKKEFGYIDENAKEFMVIDLYNQIPYSTFNTKKILNWDISKEVGYISYKNNDLAILLYKKANELLNKLDEASTYSLDYKEQGNNKTFYKFIDKKEEYESLLGLKENNKIKSKINKKQILFYVGTRLGFCCNPKYVLLELIKKNKKLDIIWVAFKEELCDEIKALGVEVLPLKDKEKVFKALNESKIIIYNDSLPLEFTPNKKQILINTWHGAINYKKIGLEGELFMSEYEKKIFMLTNPTPRYFVSGSASFLNNTSLSFNYDKKIFIKSGLPRNDILINRNFKANEIKEKLGLSKNKKICLYAPTFRNDNVASIHNLNLSLLKESLEKRFGEEFEFIYRGHAFTVNFWKDQGFIDLSNYPDQQDLLLISDVLISDYSSIMWDASLIDIPVFIYAPDYYQYLNNERGFTSSVNSIPYPVALNNKELSNNILNFDLDIYLLKVKKHHEIEGRYDKGTASKEVVKIILKNL